MALLLLLAIAAEPTSAPADSGNPAIAPPAAPPAMGANTGVLFNSYRFSRADIDAQLAALAHTGATTVRSDALWETAEPQPPSTGVELTPPFVGSFHHYDWSHDDAIAGQLAAHGLRWLPIIDYSARWSESVAGDDHSPPASVSDYDVYAAALAARYGPGGSFWHENPSLPQRAVDTYEIWNEPDSRYFWHPAPDPVAYVKLYTSARGAIDAVQPSAHVIIGGLTSPGWFLAALLGADPGMRGQIDGVAIHPYGAQPDGVLEHVRAARLAMRADGLGLVPLYVTEFGWTTRPANSQDWAAPRDRPGYISQALAYLSHTDCGIASVFLYAWATLEQDPGNSEDWYGISPPGAADTPDTRAFTDGVHAATGPAAVNPLCSATDPLTALHRAARKLPRHAAKHKHRHRHPAKPPVRH